MMSRAMVSIWMATAYLIIYCLLLQFDNSLQFAFMMLLFSPVLVVWMVYTVLKHGKFNGPSLGDREFGYQDKTNEELGIM